MEPAAILEALRHSEGLPREALRAAGERRADMVPLLVEQVENYVRADAAARAKGNAPLFFIFHLLGEWRETSAYRALAGLLRSDPEIIEDILGDATTETTHRVMAAVFDGDPAPLYNIILDANADQFVRSRMCETLAMLVLEGRLGRDEVAAFLRDCWINLQPRAGCFVWNGWQSAIAVLGLVELKDIVEEAFDRKIIDPSWLDHQDFEDDLTLALLKPTEPWGDRSEEYTAFGDVIEELSTWHFSSQEHQQDHEQDAALRRALFSPLFPPSEPATNPLRGIGRNDPCPCGSGKKYKKCCLN